MPRPRRGHRTSILVLHAASGVLKIAKPIAGVVPIPALEPVVDVLLAVIRQIKAAHINGETEARFLRKVSDLDEVIIRMVHEANIVSGDARFVLQEQLGFLARALVEIQAIATELKGGGGFRGWWRRFSHAKHNDEVLAEMNKRLADAQARFSLGMQSAIQNAVHRVEELVKNAEEQRIIDSIPHAEAGFLCVREMKSGFMKGTRKQTFEILETWACSRYPTDAGYPRNTGYPDPPHTLTRIFLLTGGAGLGKSAVAHQLCLRFVDPNQWGRNLGASFFFSRGGVDSAHALFSTIAHQLALSQPSLTPSIRDAARAFLAGGKEQQVRRTFEELLLKPLAGSMTCPLFHETTFIVVDGLDECKDREIVPELLRCLVQLVRGVPWLRVFLSTRPETHILPILISQSAADLVYHRRLDDVQAMGESRESVEFYLRDTIPKIHPFGDFVHAHPEQLDRLVDRADGLFIYARVAVNYLGMYDTRPEERFELLLECGGVRLSPLDRLYLQVLQSAFFPGDLADYPAMHKRLHDLLTFIALRRRALPPAAISLLLTLGDDDVLWMADRLRAVLLLDEWGNLIPLHATFAEFLLDSKRCIDSLYYIDPSKGNAFLASKCLAVFDFDMATLYLRSKSDLLVGSHASINGDVMLSWRLYVFHWRDHLRSAEYSDELQQDLRAMLDGTRVMTRLYDAVIGVEVNCIKCFIQDTHEATKFCREYLNLRFYCELRWRKMAGDFSANRAASVTIAELECCWDSFVEGEDLEGVVDLSFSIQSEDITRYTLVLQGLVDKIQNSETGHLWYNFDLGYKDWDPL